VAKVVPTIIENKGANTVTSALEQAPSYNIPGLGSNSLDFNQFGSYLSELKKREQKASEKMKSAVNEEMSDREIAQQSIFNYPKQRGRKPIYIKQQEQNALDELRRKRKKLVTVLHQEISEVELIEHLRMILLIIRNLTLVKQNEHYLVKSFKVREIVVSLFVDLIDQEITLNCLDIITHIAKHLVLKDSNFGQLLVSSLFTLFSSRSYLFQEGLFVKQ
jgi:hypothetical protein